MSILDYLFNKKDDKESEYKVGDTWLYLVSDRLRALKEKRKVIDMGKEENMNHIEKLYKKIKELDPKEEIVKIDVSNRKIEYNEDLIKLYEEITNLTNEEIVRAYIVIKLIKKLGYSKKYCIKLDKNFKYLLFLIRNKYR